jgi:hypothetical protein
MLPLDSYVQTSVGNRHPRSETQLRLYWSTFERMARQVTVPRRKILLRMNVQRLFSALRKGRHALVQSDVRTSELGSRTPHLISEERQV